jgi:hypothetical protein
MTGLPVEKIAGICFVFTVTIVIPAHAGIYSVQQQAYLPFCPYNRFSRWNG